VLFAINSAIHSYLIVRYSEGDKVAMQVGAYYASNSVGRLLGTILSGVMYTYIGPSIVTGFGVCVCASVGFSMISVVVDAWLREDQPGATWFKPLMSCFQPRIRGVGEEEKAVELNASNAPESTEPAANAVDQAEESSEIALSPSA
jgi:hypothetical protein